MTAATKVFPKPHEGYKEYDPLTDVRLETLEILLQQLTPFVQSLTESAGTVYVIHYDVSNGSKDADFFWSKESRDAKLKDIMEGCITEWKKYWDDASAKHRQAVLNVEQFISHGKIEEAFYSDSWETIKGPDDYYYNFDCEIPNFITTTGEMFTGALSRAVTVLRKDHEMLTSLRDKHLNHTAAVVKALVQKRIEDIDNLLGRVKDSLTTKCAQAYTMGYEQGLRHCGKANPHTTSHTEPNPVWASFEHGYIDGCMTPKTANQPTCSHE